MIVSLFSPHTIRMGDRAGSVVPGWLPVRWETTWAEFLEVLRETSLLPADPAEKNRVTSYSCAEFASGFNRSKEGVLGCDLIGFDFDDKTGDTPGAWRFDALVDFLDQQGAPYLVHTTASCTEAAQCLRLLLPLDRRVSAADYAQVWRSFSDWLGSVADEATKDASRLFFEPRCWEGRYNRIHHGHPDRPPIVVDEIVARHPPRAPEPAPATWTGMRYVAYPDMGFTVVENLTDLDTSPVVSRRALEAAMTARAGGRMYRFLCTVAVAAKRQGILLTEPDLIEIGHALAQRIGRRQRDDIRRDAINAIQFAERVGDADARPKSWPIVPLPRRW